MKSYNSFIQRHLSKYPLMEKLDIFKLLYQDNLLVNHFVDPLNILVRIDNELNSFIQNSNLSDENIYEYLSDTTVRVNIFNFVKYFNKELLADLFFKTSKVKPKNDLEKVVKEYNLVDLYNQYLNCAPSHSQIYRDNYHPSYRVVASKLLDASIKARNLQNFIEKIRNDSLQIIALEGRCGSGKSTISKMLKDVTVIEMDDHFDSVNDPVNVEYIASLLSSLKVGDIILEKCYDCHRNNYYYKEKKITNIVVVEGVYSYLDSLKKYYSHLCYIVLDKELQIERIKDRKNFNQFIEKWIPREEKYFDEFDFIKNADILI